MGVDVGSDVAVGRGVVDGSVEGTAVLVGGSVGTKVAVGSGSRVTASIDTVSDLSGPQDANKHTEIAITATMPIMRLRLIMGPPPNLKSTTQTYEHNNIGAPFSQWPNGYE